MAISLGREYTLNINGVVIDGVRDTTVNETTSELTFQPYGSRQVFTYTTGYTLDMSFETIDSAWFQTGSGLLESGEQTPVIITDIASNTVWSFNAVVTSISDGQPLDGVRSVQTTLKLYAHNDSSPLRAGDTNP